MAEKKASAGRKKSTNTAANPGKVKGAGTVTPKDPREPTHDYTPPEPAQTDTPREQQTTRADVDVRGAFKAGRLASDRGYPSKPPKGLTEAEIKDWYDGYKSVANPQSQNSLRPEDPNKPDGYRGSY